MNTLLLLFFFYGVGWRSFGMKRSHSPMNMTANISSSWMICPNERIPVTCQSFTMAAPFVSFGLSRRSDVVEQAFRRNKETRKKDKRVNDSISIRHAYIYYITTQQKWWRPDAWFFLFSLPRGRRGGRSFMLMTTERGKHTCSKTNKKGKKKKNGQLMATRKQVGSIEKYTQSLLTCTTHTQKLFLLMLAIYIHDDCCANVGHRRRRDMLVKNGADNARDNSDSTYNKRSVDPAAPAELQPGGVALNVFRYSPLALPSSFDSIHYRQRSV